MARRSILRRDSSFSLSNTGDVSEPSLTSLGSAVSFGSVQVRNYERVLADAPEAGSCYTSFAIGWTYDEEEDMSIDEFECGSNGTKVMGENDDDITSSMPAAGMPSSSSSSSSSTKKLRALSPMERFNVLGSYGFSHEELKESEQKRASLVSEKKSQQKKKGFLSRLRKRR